MPDLLIYGTTPAANTPLIELAQSKGVRVKATTDAQTAYDWLKVRSFDFAFVHMSVPIAEQQQLADLLWDRNPSALLYAVSLERADLSRSEPRLYGAEVAKGDDALHILGKALDAFTPSESSESPLHIMVVEDLDSPRDIICIFLESLGHPHVTSKSSASDALDALHEEPGRYTAIVTDYRMPGMNGDEFIREIRRTQQLRFLPIIVLTAYGTLDCLIECLKAGASGFLVKPPKRADFERELGRARRILRNRLNPRLVSSDEAESLREVLERRGL